MEEYRSGVGAHSRARSNNSRLRDLNNHRKTDTHEQQQPRVTRNYRFAKSVQIKVQNTSFFEVFKSTFEHTEKQLKIQGKETLITSCIEILWKIHPSALENQNLSPQDSFESFRIMFLEAESIIFGESGKLEKRWRDYTLTKKYSFLDFGRRLVAFIYENQKLINKFVHYNRIKRVKTRSDERISFDALHVLINCLEEPFVSNIAVNYLKATFKEQLDVISFPIPDVLEPTENHTDLIPENLDANFDAFSEHRPTVLFRLHKITCLLLFGVKKKLLIILVILLLILVLVVFSHLIRHLKSSQEESVGNFRYQLHKIPNEVSTTEISLDQTKFDDTQNLKDKRKEANYIQVTSFKELMDKLHNITSPAPIFLKIVSGSAGIWANEKYYGDCSKVEAIEVGGEINILDIRQILIKMQNAHKVVLKNDKNNLCNLSRHIVQEFSRNTIKNISKLVLKKLTACSKVYQVLSHSMLMTEIRELVIDECIIEVENSLHIQAMLHNSRDTLESIEFSRTVFRSSIINHKLRTFGELRYLKMDILNAKNDKNLVYIPRQIHHIFPFLETFNSSSGYFPLEEFISLAQCDKLKTIQIGLHVFGNPSKFEVDLLFNDIPLLKNVKLALKFSESKFNHGCKLFGLVDLKRRVDILEIRSNCSIEY